MKKNNKKIAIISSMIFLSLAIIVPTSFLLFNKNDVGNSSLNGILKSLNQNSNAPRMQ